MDRIETWLEPTSHKILAAFVVLASLSLLGSYITSLSAPKEMDTIHLSHVFEYGLDGVTHDTLKSILSLQDDKGEPLIYDIEDEALSYIGRYDVSFQLNDKQLRDIQNIKMTSEDLGSDVLYWSYLTSITPDNITPTKVSLNIKGDTFYGVVELEYYIIDTQAPLFENPTQDIVLDHPQNITLDVAKASDPVDGDVVVTWHGSFDTNKPGVYPLEEIATDRNGNRTINHFTLTVLE